MVGYVNAGEDGYLFMRDMALGWCGGVRSWFGRSVGFSWPGGLGFLGDLGGVVVFGLGFR